MKQVPYTVPLANQHNQTKQPGVAIQTTGLAKRLTVGVHSRKVSLVDVLKRKWGFLGYAEERIATNRLSAISGTHIRLGLRFVRVLQRRCQSIRARCFT